MTKVLKGFQTGGGALAGERRPWRSAASRIRCTRTVVPRFAARWSVALLMTALVIAGVARAAGDLTAQQPVDARVQMGTAQNALRFAPNVLYFETGKLYRLVLTNPSPQKHYFSSDALAQAVLTRKVQVNGRDGKPIAEIKGHIREVEVHPYGTSEWWFVPVKAGEFNDLRCTIPGHSEAGMVGKIIVR
jgi:uncharacterized cupredoxin-like copper-binding protein